MSYSFTISTSLNCSDSPYMHFITMVTKKREWVQPFLALTPTLPQQMTG